MFVIPTGASRPYPLRVMATSELGWEHVSVALPMAVKRCPTWEEMCLVKELFWDPEDAVWQLHPPRSEYVNCHPYCLHLWRPVSVELPRPPAALVGVPGQEPKRWSTIKVRDWRAGVCPPDDGACL